MADREQDGIAPVGSPDTNHAGKATASSLGGTLDAHAIHNAAQLDSTPTDDAMENALSASLELLNNSIEQTGYALLDDTLRAANTAGAGQHSDLTANTVGESNQALLAALLSNQQATRVVANPSMDALRLSDSSRVAQYSTFDGTTDEDVDKHTSGPVETPEPLSNLSADAHSLGAQLESIYQTTASLEMKQIIACLVHLDIALTHQTHLNNLHEVYTAKNFREQRHLNKDRKLHLLETIQNVNKKFARFDAERMETEKSVKQCEIRTNGYGLQLQGLKERVKMLANGGEWMEAELAKITARFEVLQQENARLKGQNKDLKRKVRLLEDEVDVLKERDGLWERRMTALEELVKERTESDWHEVSIDKEHVFDAVRFSVGNYRVFSMYH